jgi:WD40 repeat protein
VLTVGKQIRSGGLSVTEGKSLVDDGLSGRDLVRPANERLHDVVPTALLAQGGIRNGVAAATNVLCPSGRVTSQSGSALHRLVAPNVKSVAALMLRMSLFVACICWTVHEAAIVRASETDLHFLFEPPVATKASSSSGQQAELLRDQFGDPLPAGAIARIGTVRFRHVAAPGISSTVAFGPDGKTIVSSCNLDIVVWEAATGRPLRRLAPQPHLVNYVTLSRDRQTVAALWEGREVRIWDTATGRQLVSWEHIKAWAVVFAPDLKRYVTIERYHIHRLWDAATGKELYRLPGPDEAIQPEPAFSPDGAILAHTDGDKRILLTEVSTGKEIRRFEELPMPPDTLIFSPNGELLVSADYTINRSRPKLKKSVWLWDVATGRKLRRLGNAEEAARPLAFAPDSRTLVSCAGDSRSMIWWDVVTGKEIRRRDDYPGGIKQIAFSPDGKTLAGLGGDHVVRLWDAATGDEILPRFGLEGPVTYVDVSSDGRLVATGGGHGVQLWESNTGKELRRLPGNQDLVGPIALSADGRILVSAASDKTICIWELATGQILRRLRGHQNTIQSLVLAHDGKTLASSSCKNSVRVWDVASGNELRRIPVDFTKWDKFEVTRDHDHFAFSADSRTLITVARSKDSSADNYRTAVCFWDLASGTERQQAINGFIEGLCMAFSPDRKLAAFHRRRQVDGEQIGTISFVELNTGTVIRQIEGPDVWGFWLEFSPDGKTLAVSCHDEPVVRFWEVATGKERHRLTGHAGWIGAIAFAADGNLVVTGSRDTSALVWDLRAGAGGKRPIAAKELEGLWSELGGDEATSAYLAIGKLVSGGAQTTRFLRERMQPVPRVPPERLARLISDLDDAEFSVREAATKELENLRESAVVGLKKALADQPSAEARSRIQLVLEKVEKPGVQPHQLQGLRGIEVLEGIGDREAYQVLANLAKGVEGARLTREAKASLDSLDRRFRSR